MGLMAEFTAENRPRGPMCSVRKTAELIGGTDAEELWEAVEGGLVPATTISRVLARRNLTLKPAAITKHRRKECGCAK